MARQITNKPEEMAALKAEPKDQPEDILIPVADDENDMGVTQPSFGVAHKKKPVHVKVAQYRVERGPLPTGGWSVMVSGKGKTELAAGKIIDERQYDIEKLRLQGVLLTALGEV